MNTQQPVAWVEYELGNHKKTVQPEQACPHGADSACKECHEAEQPAAAELRRLYEINEAFGKRQEWWNDRMFKLEAENKALREALKEIVDAAPQQKGTP